jgi:hypothetical protein
MQSKEVSTRYLKLLVLSLCILVAAFHLGSALAGKPLFRASHLGTALEYGRGSINLFRPIMIGFNATGTPTALEFPLWQAAAGLVFKVFHSSWYGWANVVSLLFFATALWPFFQLARQYAGERAAWWSLIFFLAEPLIVINAGEAATDGFSLVTIIWFLFFADKMIRSGELKWWIPTALFAACSAVSKLPFFMSAGLCSIFILLLNGVRAKKPWILLAGAGLFAAIVFGAWTHYTSRLAAEAVFPFEELRLDQSPSMRFWYFGDLHLRLSPGPWIKGGWRLLHGTLGALPVIALFAWSLLRPGNWLPKLWLLATFLTTLVFTHLVLEHWHYYLMCCPAVALLCGATLERWEGCLAGEFARPRLAIALVGVVLVGSAVDGIISMKIAIDYDSYTKDMSQIIHDHTRPEDKLIIYDAGFHPWGGETLFRSERQGLSVAFFNTSPSDPNVTGLVELLNEEKNLNRLKSLGYTKLVLISESPVQFAAQAINPGSKRTRFYYPKSISPKVDAWPVVYQTEDILIKEIP